MIRDKRNDAITVYRYRRHNSMARGEGGDGGEGAMEKSTAKLFTESIERGMPATFPCLIDIHQANNHRDEHNKPPRALHPSPPSSVCLLWTRLGFREMSGGSAKNAHRNFTNLQPPLSTQKTASTWLLFLLLVFSESLPSLMNFNAAYDNFFLPSLSPLLTNDQVVEPNGSMPLL